MWCRVTITYPPTGYQQNYKRQIAAHSHGAAQALTLAAMQDSLQKINAHLPQGQPPAVQNHLGILNQAAYEQNDPGITWRII